MSFKYEAWVLFLALFALYSPVAALSSYLPIIRPYSNAQRIRLSVGLFVNAAVFVLVAIWVGEPLLKLLGISTAALTATGGIALILAAVPLMRGAGEAAADDSALAPKPTIATVRPPPAVLYERFSGTRPTLLPQPPCKDAGRHWVWIRG